MKQNYAPRIPWKGGPSELPEFRLAFCAAFLHKWPAGGLWQAQIQVHTDNHHNLLIFFVHKIRISRILSRLPSGFLLCKSMTGKVQKHEFPMSETFICNDRHVSKTHMLRPHSLQKRVSIFFLSNRLFQTTQVYKPGFSNGCDLAASVSFQDRENGQSSIRRQSQIPCFPPNSRQSGSWSKFKIGAFLFFDYSERKNTSFVSPMLSFS